MAAPKVTYKVNLGNMFDGAVRIPDGMKESIGQEIIDRIVERTQDGIDKNGASLGKYKQDNDIFGKSKGGRVNLTQTEDMLSALTIIGTTAKTLTIGYTDKTENDKAYGHISGFKGHPTLAGKVQKRDFLGLPTKDLGAIAKDFQDDVDTVTRVDQAQTRQDLDREVLSYLDELETQIVPTSGLFGRIGEDT